MNPDDRYKCQEISDAKRLQYSLEINECQMITSADIHKNNKINFIDSKYKKVNYNFFEFSMQKKPPALSKSYSWSPFITTLCYFFKTVALDFPIVFKCFLRIFLLNASQSKYNSKKPRFNKHFVPLL